MNCPRCNHEIPEGKHFCEECGTRVEAVYTCKKCGAILSGGVLFCPNCANSTIGIDAENDDGISEKYDTENGMQPQSSFAETSSGDAVSASSVQTNENTGENLEKTMAIPVVKSGSFRSVESNREPQHVKAARTHTSYSQSGAHKASQKPMASSQAGSGVHPNRTSTGQPHTKGHGANSVPAKKKKKSVQTQKNILIFLIVFLIVILIGLVGIIIFMMNTGKSVPKETVTMGENTGNASVIRQENDLNEEPDEESETDEKEEPGEDGSSSHVDTYDFRADFDYDFVYGANLQKEPDETTQADGTEGGELAEGDDGEISSGLQYVSYENADYSLSYNIPAIFDVDESHVDRQFDEVRYVTPDGTAYIDVGARENDKDLSLETVLNGTIDALGGSADYESSGRDWFVLRVVKNGITYYQKCYVDEYIRYFEVAFPAEYSEVYDEHIDGVKNGFSRTE